MAFCTGQHFHLPEQPLFTLHMALSRWLWARMAPSQHITMEGKQSLIFLSLLPEPKPWVQLLHPWQIRLANDKLWIHPGSPAKNIQVNVQKKSCYQQVWKLQVLSDQNLQKINLYMNFYFSFRTTLQSDRVRLTICCGEKYSHTQDYIIKLLCKLYMQAVPVRTEVIVIMHLNIRSGFK